MIKVLRVSRIVRIIKALELIHELFIIIMASLPAIFNVLCLLLLFILIYSVLGVFIYHDLNYGKFVNEYSNFKNFGEALIVLLKLSTGDSWSSLMYECARQKGGLLSAAYFGSFVILTSFIMLNLFIMVILQSYEDHKTEAYKSIVRFQDHIKNFKKVWAKHSSKGYRISYSELPNFIKSLDETEWNLTKIVSDNKVCQLLASMLIQNDYHGYVYYNDILYAFLKRKIRHKLIGHTSKVAKRIIKKEVNNTKRKLKKKRKKIMKKLDNTAGETFVRDITRKFNLMSKVIANWRGYAVYRKRKRDSADNGP